MPFWRSKRSDGDELHVGDPRFDDWEVVREFEDAESAHAWRRHLEEAGIEAVVTADHELDRLGRGRRLPPGAGGPVE